MKTQLSCSRRKHSLGIQIDSIIPQCPEGRKRNKLPLSPDNTTSFDRAYLIITCALCERCSRSNIYTSLKRIISTAHVLHLFYETVLRESTSEKIKSYPPLRDSILAACIWKNSVTLLLSKVNCMWEPTSYLNTWPPSFALEWAPLGDFSLLTYLIFSPYNH